MATATDDLDIPQMMQQLIELQRVSRETYNIQRQLIEYNDNLNTQSFMSQPGYGGVPAGGGEPSTNVNDILNSTIAQELSKPRQALQRFGRGMMRTSGNPPFASSENMGKQAEQLKQLNIGPMLQDGSFYEKFWVNNTKINDAIEKTHSLRGLRTEIRALRHLATPLLMGGKLSVGTIRSAVHMGGRYVPGLLSALTPIAIGSTIANIGLEIYRSYIEKQTKETEAESELMKMTREKFKYNPQTINMYAERLRLVTPQRTKKSGSFWLQGTRWDDTVWNEVIDNSIKTWDTRHYKDTQSTLNLDLHTPENGIIPLGWVIDPTNTTPYEIESVKKRTQEKVVELSKEYGEMIAKRRKYASRFFGLDAIYKKAMDKTKKQRENLSAEELQAAKDALLGEGTRTQMKYNTTTGEYEEHMAFVNEEFDKQFQKQIEMEEGIKKIVELLKYRAEHDDSGREKVIQGNQEKLSEALKQQYALEKSNWTEI